MKPAVIAVLIAACFSSHGQNFTKYLKKINNVNDAVGFIRNHPEAEGRLMPINSNRDSTEYFRNVFKRKAGDIVLLEGYSVKILQSNWVPSFRASYIFLNGNKLTFSKIDTIRTVILDNIAKGRLFATLAREYTMDGNTAGGDLGWFDEGMMVRDFEMAIRSHHKGDLFTVDIPDNKWYYVVWKTFDDRENQHMTILRVKNER